MTVRRDHPLFDDRFRIRMEEKPVPALDFRQQFRDAASFRVFPDDADERRNAAERGKVRDDVSGAAEHLLATSDFKHRHRRFRRNAVDRPVREAVEH